MIDGKAQKGEDVGLGLVRRDPQTPRHPAATNRALKRTPNMTLETIAALSDDPVLGLPGMT
jgi:hypothetical protein